MQIIPYSKARDNFRGIMEQLCDNHESVVITHQNARPVVMMSLEDYSATEETLYLVSKPNNAARLLRAMADVKQGKYKSKKIN